MAEELRVAKHFPKVLKPCKDVAKPFFDCFSTNSVQPEGGVRPVLRLRFVPHPPRSCRLPVFAGC